MFKTATPLVSLVASLFFLGCDPGAEPQKLDTVDSQFAGPEAAPSSQELETRGSKLGRLLRDRFSCKGRCDGSAYGQCWCDDLCTDFDDCCHDYEPVCNASSLCGTRGAPLCDEGEFCNFPQDNDCGRTDKGGSCEPVPDFCTREFDPVCGCDGKTYGNACMAATRGVSVDYEGECEASAGPVACGARAGDTCGEDEYCAYQPGAYCGAADAESVCKPRPDVCTQEAKPVCGCDGKTYGNACMANAAGQGVLAQGPCEEPPPPTGVSCGGEVVVEGNVCAKGEFCKRDVSAQCGAADEPGVCTQIPTACTEEFAPVCGCDGNTYSNECQAHAAGVSAASIGPCIPAGENCGGLLGLSCDKGEYCDIPVANQCGAADGGGICKEIPQGCDKNYDPVCGCDGQSYGNACMAAMAGVSIQALGECKVNPNKKCVANNQCPQGEWCNTSLCAGCDAGPDGICPAVCFGYCEPLPGPVKLCMSDEACNDGWVCDTNQCLSGCANKPGVFCPAVCFGLCVPPINQ